MSEALLAPTVIARAHERIAPYINRTPLFHSTLLNHWLGHEFVFKVEGLQKVGAFKVRGALNALLSLQEEGNLPDSVVAFSSGNHAQAVAYAAKQVGVPATILLPADASGVKRQATAGYGAKVIVAESRAEAEARTAELQAEGAYLLHPYDDDRVLAGQGTACYEALNTGLRPDAIFATCGGGGWLSGTYLAAQLLAPRTAVYGAEPAQANDAAQSYRSGDIIRFADSPHTIADGARTLCVSPRTFQYLKRLAGFYEIEEGEIIYWTQWLAHLLKTPVEPTSAVAMAGACAWAKRQSQPRQVLVMLSGGNIAAKTYLTIWAQDLLSVTPDRHVADRAR